MHVAKMLGTREAA